jgi:T5SS/PEP-CTERM-associated repeat protein
MLTSQRRALARTFAVCAAFGLGTFGVTAQAQISNTGQVSPAVTGALGATTAVGNSLIIGGQPSLGAGSVLVEGTNTILQMNNAGASPALLSVGTVDGPGTLTIQNEGRVNIDSTGTAGSVLYISTDITGSNAFSQDGTVNMNLSTLSLTSQSDAIIGIGRHGTGCCRRRTTALSMSRLHRRQNPPACMSAARAWATTPSRTPP